MKLYYYRAAEGNFGDDLNPWLWPRLLGNSFFDDDETELFVGIGTLLNHRIPIASKTHVFGSGHGYGTKPKIDSSWAIHCVRGPRTALTLGLDLKLAITDPAILIFDYTRDKVNPEPGRIGYIPHCDSARYGDWDALSKMAGLSYINPSWAVDRIIAEIGRCEYILTEAMHGAIFADAMRVPWIPIVAYSHISEFKWIDWCESMHLQYAPMAIPSIWIGDSSNPLAQRAKDKIKRSLAKIGIWQHTWDMPPPPRSSQRERDKAVEEFIKITKHSAPMLSTEITHANRISQLKESLGAFSSKLDRS